MDGAIAEGHCYDPRMRRAAHADARLRLEIQGAVQGVGFRPFVFRLAEELELAGWVRNDSRGVFLEVEGERAVLERFAARAARRSTRRAASCMR